MTRPRIAPVGTILLVIAAGACGPAGKSPPRAAAATVDTAAVMAGIADLWDRWATADTSENFEAILGMMSESVWVDARGFPPMTSREAVRAVFAPLYAQVDYLEASATPQITVAMSNNLVNQAGTIVERYTVKGRAGEMTDYGRYAASFVRGADGRWRWGYMMAMVDSTVTKK
ncbi:MAG TPA: hypothetical protein VF862_07150 [Gemmatimonadales bacterium]